MFMAANSLFLFNFQTLQKRKFVENIKFMFCCVETFKAPNVFWNMYEYCEMFVEKFEWFKIMDTVRRFKIF